MKLPRCALTALLLVATLPLTAQATEIGERFSNAIGVDGRASAGLTHLTPDETAVLDALVRRDASRLASTAQPSAPTFSQRLTVDEYRSAGLSRLTAAELVDLDALVASTEAPAAAPFAATLSASGVSRSTDGSVRETAKWQPDLHGQVFMEFGGGRGFSERAGGIVLTLEDPPHRTAVSVGYMARRLDVH